MSPEGVRLLALACVLVCAAAVGLPGVGAQNPRVIDHVIATVGGELVLLSELEEQVALARTQSGRGLPPEGRCQIMEQLLSAKLLVNQAKLDSVDVSDEEVEAQLDARFERILAMMNGDLQQFEEYYGQTITDVRTQFRDDLKSQLLAERMRARIVEEAKITPAEVRAFFETIPNDSLPYFNSEVELRELVYRPKANPASRQRARERIEALRAQIVDGTGDFAALARKNSADPGSGRQGGELGWAPRGTFVPEFEAAAYRLERDEVSEVVESPFGFHIIQLLERRGNRIRTRHILIKPEIEESDLAAGERLLDSIRGLVLADSMLFRVAVARFGDDDEQSHPNGGRLENPATGNTFFEIADLEPVTFFAIDTLEVGGITGPVRYEQPGSGEVVYRIFQLDSRSRPHKASLETDYNKIRNAAVEARRSEILSDWLARTIADTYISLAPGIAHGCELDARWLKEEVSGTQP